MIRMEVGVDLTRLDDHGAIEAQRLLTVDMVV
jgi:hypothetical protein